MQKFVVSARKYRPQRFDEVVGQEHVAQTLKNAMTNNSLAHAFLFCGPRGVGKTTCARILAKTLNCERVGDDREPCNTCGRCTSFNENASFNITELDAASNNSVEHIRALIEQVRFAPQQGDYKVFIIDEVHMLSSQAFNAFLKTLEEPPSYAKFILATTEKHKILPTILSRCQIFDFRRIQVQDIVGHLENICKEEKIKAEPDALHIIAQKADGALRDALSIFDRMVSFGGKEITYDAVIANLNILDYDYFFKVVDDILTENVSGLLNTFDEIVNNGFDPDIFINGLAEHVRNLLVCQHEKSLHLLELSDKLKARYHEQATVAPKSFLLTALNICNDCDVNYRMARNKRLHVEMSLIKMAHIQKALLVTPLATAEKKTLEIGRTKPAAKKEAPVAKKATLPAPVAKQETALPKVEEEPVQMAAPKPVENTTVAAPEVVSKSKVEVPEEGPGFPESEMPQTTSMVQEPMPSPAAAKPSSNLTSASSSSLLSKLETEVLGTSDESEEEKLPDLEFIKKAWEEESLLISSPTFKNILKHAKLSMDGPTLIVSVGSRMARDMVINEVGFSRALKNKVNFQKLIFQVEVDPELVTAQTNTKPRKVLSMKETYDLMKDTNPLVEDLRVRFDLKIDR